MVFCATSSLCTCWSRSTTLRAEFRGHPNSSPNNENRKANRIETMKVPAESGQIGSVGRRKIAKKISKNKRCYANTLRPRSRDAVEADEGGVGGVITPWVILG